MKKAAFSLLAIVALAATSFAGTATAGKEYKQPVAPATCFADQELQVDVFGSYTWADGASDYNDGLGGGVGVNYFFMRNLGVGVDGNVYDGGPDGVWNVSGSLIVRFPMDETCLAPYALIGGGVLTDSNVYGTAHAGIGIEYRAIPHRLGVFAEGRYVWVPSNNEFAQARAGVRVVF